MTLEELITKACDSFKIAKDDLYSKDRKGGKVYARWVVWYAMKKHLNIKPSLIAYKFRKSPATVLYGLEKVEDERKYGNKMVAELMDIIDKEGVTYGC